MGRVTVKDFTLLVESNGCLTDVIEITLLGYLQIIQKKKIPG